MYVLVGCGRVTELLGSGTRKIGCSFGKELKLDSWWTVNTQSRLRWITVLELRHQAFWVITIAHGHDPGVGNNFLCKPPKALIIRK